jgi:hypothetical protein
MPDGKGNRALRWMGNIMAISAFMSLLWGGIGWLMEPHVETFIMDVVKDNKGPSTRGEIADSLGIHKVNVVPRIVKMMKEFKETQTNIEKFNETWIPYLEDEKTFFHVGFFVIFEDNIWKVKYRDFDQEEYKCWHDDAGWYYMKAGYKYYK